MQMYFHFKIPFNACVEHTFKQHNGDLRLLLFSFKHTLNNNVRKFNQYLT